MKHASTLRSPLGLFVHKRRNLTRHLRCGKAELFRKNLVRCRSAEMFYADKQTVTADQAPPWHSSSGLKGHTRNTSRKYPATILCRLGKEGFQAWDRDNTGFY